MKTSKKTITHVRPDGTRLTILTVREKSIASPRDKRRRNTQFRIGIIEDEQQKQK